MYQKKSILLLIYNFTTLNQFLLYYVKITCRLAILVFSPIISTKLYIRQNIITIIGDLMNRNRLVFAGLLILIAVLSVGMVMAVSDTNKTATKLTIKAKSPIHEGDKIKIKLTDVNNTPISNQTVKVTITDKEKNSYKYSVVTNKKGVAKLKLDKGEGKYKIKCKFRGNDKYNATQKTKKITVEEEESDDDPGAFYSEQAGRVIYTGEVQEGPDGNWYQHVGYNEWVQV